MDPKGPPPITPLEMTEEQSDFAEKIAKRLGYSQTAYSSSSGLWGLFCINDRPLHKKGCIILTKEFGFLFVQDLEDMHFYDLDDEAKKKERKCKASVKS